MAECFYCEKDNEKRKALMLDVCELPYSIVYLFRDQKNKDRCVVAFKGHKTEYFQLTPEEKRDIVAYVHESANARSQGGYGLGGFGPAPEGMAMWIIGMVAVIGAAMWIGARA